MAGSSDHISLPDYAWVHGPLTTAALENVNDKFAVALDLSEQAWAMAVSNIEAMSAAVQLVSDAEDKEIDIDPQKLLDLLKDISLGDRPVLTPYTGTLPALGALPEAADASDYVGSFSSSAEKPAELEYDDTPESPVTGDITAILPTKPVLEVRDFGTTPEFDQSDLVEVPEMDFTRESYELPVKDIPDVDQPDAPVTPNPVFDFTAPVKPDFSYVFPASPVFEEIEMPDTEDPDPYNPGPDYTPGSAPVLATAPTMSELTEIADPDFTEAITAYNDLMSSVTTLADYLDQGIANDGVPVDVSEEEAIFQRAHNRLVAERDRSVAQDVDRYAAMGFTMPSGVLASMVAARDNTLTQQIEDLNYHTVETMAKIRQENRALMVTQANAFAQTRAEILKVLMGILTEAARIRFEMWAEKTKTTLEYDKTAAAVWSDKAKIEFETWAQQTKTEFEVWLEKDKQNFNVWLESGKFVLEKNRMLMELKRLNMDLIKFRLDVYLAQLDAVLKELTIKRDVYLAELEGYKSLTSTEIAKLEALIETYKARMTAYTADKEITARIYGIDVEAFRALNSAEDGRISALVEKYKAEVNAATAGNDIKIRAHLAEAELFKIAGELELTRVKTLADVFGAEVDAYEAEVDAQAKTVGLDYERYKADVEAYRAIVSAKADKYRSEIQAYIAERDGDVKVHTMNAEIFKAVAMATDERFRAVVQKYAEEVKAFTVLSELPVRQYNSEIEAFKANAQAVTEELRLRSSVVDSAAKLEIAKSDAEVRLSETVDKVKIAMAQLNASMMETIGKLAAQLTASALGSVHASASLSGAYSESQQQGSSKSVNYEGSIRDSYNYDYKMD